MDWEKFVRLCERANIRPQERWRTPYGPIFIGDRISFTDAKNGIDRIDLYETFWFAEDGIGGLWGQPIRHLSFFREDGSRITQREFYDEALDQALGCMADKLHGSGLSGINPFTTQIDRIPWNIDPVRKVVTGGVMNGVLHG